MVYGRVGPFLGEDDGEQAQTSLGRCLIVLDSNSIGLFTWNYMAFKKFSFLVLARSTSPMNGVDVVIRLDVVASFMTS